MIFWPGPEGTAMQKVVDHFNATLGKTEHINVQQVLISRSATFAKEGTLIAAHSSEFDVYFTASYIVGQQAPGLIPLSGITSKDYFPSTYKSLEVGGKLYAVPLDVSNHFLYYRSDLISKLLSNPAWIAQYAQISKKVLGVSLKPKPPADWNWNDFLATAAFFTKSYNPASPTTYGSAMQLENIEFDTMIWNDVLWSFGGSWTNSKGQANIDTPAALKAMQVYRTTFVDHLTSPDSDVAEYPQTQAALSSGKAAIALQWSSGYPQLASKSQSPQVAGKIAITSIPGTTHLTYVHTLADALNRYGTHQAAATKWIQYLATPAAMLIYAKAGGIPSMPSVLSKVASTQPAGYYASIISVVSKGGFSEPIDANTQLAFTDLSSDLSAAWAGLTSDQSALQKAQRDLQSLYG
jgi:multiple sugar transport system substrate-binding protein